MNLQNGDRVVFYGDSITEQQLYTVYVEAFVRTRFPNLEISFYNRGWGGDTSWGQEEGGTPETRAKRDVAPLDPTVLSVMMGMNDGGYVPHDPDMHPRLEAEYRNMISLLRKAAPDARITLCRTSPWDQYTCDPCGPYPGAPYPPKGYNDALLEYGRIVDETAKSYGFGYVDFNLPLVEVMQKAKEIDVALATQIVPDWIHPGPAGHLIMAAELLKNWDAPAMVSSVVIDVKSNTIEKATKTEITNLDGLSWTQKDECLPFCVSQNDAASELVADISGFNTRFNQENLTVQNLPCGDYELSIDGETVALLSSAKLEEGINLVEYNTPMRRRAFQVFALAAKRSMLQMTRWRQIEVKYGVEGAAGEASHALKEMEEAVLRQEVKECAPLEHSFKLQSVVR